MFWIASPQLIKVVTRYGPSVYLRPCILLVKLQLQAAIYPAVFLQIGGTMKIILNWPIILLICVLYGCAGTSGRDFLKPPNDSLILGKTTSSDMVSLLGTPQKEGQILKNDAQIATYAYIYTTTASGSAVAEGVMPQRVQVFYFLDNKLVGYDYSNSFKENSTYFESTIIKQIKKGISTRLEVEKALGVPGGNAIYPLISNQDEVALIYSYSQAKGNISNMQSYRKSLQITVNKENIVTNLDYTESGQK